MKEIIFDSLTKNPITPVVTTSTMALATNTNTNLEFWLKILTLVVGVIPSLLQILKSRKVETK